MVPQRFPATVPDCLLFLLGRAASIDLNLTLDLAGRLDESRWRTALRRSLDAEPVLGCRFVEHWRRPWWERRTDLDELPLCEVASTDGSRAARADFLLAPLDPRRDPLVQTRIFRGPTDMLSIKIAHEAADGPSVRAYVRGLLELYQRLAEEPDCRPTPNLGGTRSMRGISAGGGLKQYLGNLRRVLHDVRAARGKGAWRFPPSPGDGTRPTHVFMKLPRARVEKIVEYGRQRGVALTALMLAGFYQALGAVFEPADARAVNIGTTIDMRRFLPPEQRATPASNIAAGVRFWLDPAETSTFDALATRLARQLGEGLADPGASAASVPAVTLYPLVDGLLSAVPFACYRGRMLRRLAASTGRTSRMVFFGNGGRLDDIVAGFHELPVRDMEASGPLVDSFALFVNFTGFAGTVTVDFRFSDRILDCARAQALLHAMDRNLPCYGGQAAPREELTREPPAAVPR